MGHRNPNEPENRKLYISVSNLIINVFKNKVISTRHIGNILFSIWQLIFDNFHTDKKGG